MSDNTVDRAPDIVEIAENFVKLIEIKVAAVVDTHSPDGLSTDFRPMKIIACWRDVISLAGL